jgi:hypothetical protein
VQLRRIPQYAEIYRLLKGAISAAIDHAEARVQAEHSRCKPNMNCGQTVAAKPEESTLGL